MPLSQLLEDVEAEGLRVSEGLRGVGLAKVGTTSLQSEGEQHEFG